MYFTIHNNFKIDPNLIKASMTYNALTYVAHYKLKPSDKILENYLVKHFNSTLKACCLQIIRNITIARSTTNKYLVLINPKDEELAKLITYGNLETFGSPILQKAFEDWLK